MNSQSTSNVVDIIAGLLGLSVMVWGGIRYLLRPAYKIAQLEERAEQYKQTAESYKARIDSLLAHIKELMEEVRAQNDRSDMALLYIAERLAWERRGRSGAAPVLPQDLETALYEIASRLVRPEVSHGESPFFYEAPDDGADEVDH